MEAAAKLLLTQKKCSEAGEVQCKALAVVPCFRERKQNAFEAVCAA